MRRALVILLSVLLTGCSMSSRLDRLAVMVNDQPAEALSLLDAVGQDALKTPHLRARYALLRSIALDKCDIALQSDSVIAPAVAWYQHHGRALEQAQVLYYSGRIAYHAKDYALAAVSYSKATTLFPRIKDAELKRLILVALSETYNDSFYYGDNLELLQRAKELLPADSPPDRRFEIDLSIAAHYVNTLQ